MKIGRAFSVTLAVAGLLAFAAPAIAQSRGSNRQSSANFHRGNFNRGDRDNDRDDRRFNHGGTRVNFFFGAGFGFPWYGYYPYGYYPYYGYPYYGYPVGGYYGYDPRGVYTGQVVGGGDQGSVAVHVQQQLAQLGYYRGPIDGIIGEGTRRAIRDYKRANGLRADGRIDQQLLATMGRG